MPKEQTTHQLFQLALPRAAALIQSELSAILHKSENGLQSFVILTHYSEEAEGTGNYKLLLCPALREPNNIYGQTQLVL